MGTSVSIDGISRHEQRALDQALNDFELLRPDNAWSCDGGAAVLSDMLYRKHVPHALRIGLFAPGTDLEEHHHWIEVGSSESREGILIDPNAELRDQPRRQPLSDAVRELYQPRDELNSRSDRELMSFSPLWDPEYEELVEITELDDPCVLAYLATIDAS